MIEWLQAHETLLWWLGASSILMFLSALIIVPMLIVRLPADYFSYRRRHRKLLTGYPLPVRAAFELGKNALGLVLVILGLAMLILPGQGILTVLIGLGLVNFPGKFRLERWIVKQRPVRESVNWLRRRAGRDALIL